jgi:RNA polymerase sigma factor (sigma-70 family)
VREVTPAPDLRPRETKRDSRRAAGYGAGVAGHALAGAENVILPPATTCKGLTTTCRTDAVSRPRCPQPKKCIKRSCGDSTTIEGERRPFKGNDMATSQMSEVIQHLRRAVLLREGTGLTDGQLLKDYLGHRDEAALAALVRRHGPMVWGVCRRVLRNYHDAEDAFQATFLVFVRKAASIASPELLANWLYGVAHQTALNARATTAKRRARERQVTEMPEPAVTEEDLWGDLQPLLDQGLSRLPEKYRVAIVLCDLEGKTRKEAARQLGVPDGTLAARLARGRVLLAKRLARHGLAVSGGSLAAVLSAGSASASAPPSLVVSTMKAASLLAAGRTAGIVSLKVAALTEGVMKAMFLTKIKSVLAVVLVALTCIGGGVMGVLSMATGQQPTSKAKQDDPGKETDAEKIAHLIKQLGDDVFANREAAGKELETIGTPALAAVRNAAASSDEAEIRQRAERLVKSITEAAAKAELAKLQGVWTVDSYEMEGKQLPDKDKRSAMTIVGDKWVIMWVTDDESVQAECGILKITNPEKSPLAVDFVHLNGPHKGSTVFAISRAEGNTFKFCYHVRAEDRPTEFVTKAGDPSCGLVTFNRQKK